MYRKILFLCFTIILTLHICFVCVSADEDLAKLKTKLNELRKEIREAEIEYKKEKAEINTECQNKIAVLKNEFHKTRSEYLADKQAKLAELENSYNGKCVPMKREESQLINSIEPKEPSNFAKH